MPDGGSVGLNVVPDFSGLPSLLSSGIRPALNQLQSLGKEGGALLGSGVGLGVVAGLGAADIAIGDFVKSGVEDFIRLGEQTRKLEQLTGDSAQQTSLFAGTIKALGGNVDSTSKGLGLFSANIAKQPQLFAEYGIQVEKTKQGNVDVLGTLDNLRKSFQGTSDATQRDAVAKQLLGRSYQQLLPYLSLTDDKLKIFQDLARGGGQVLSQDDVDKARELKIQMQELTDHVEKLKLSAGRTGVGLLNNLLGNVNDDPFRALTDVGETLTGNISGLHDLFSAHGNAASAARDQAAAEIDAKDAMAALSLQAQTESTALNSIASAGEGIRSAREALVSANDGVTQSERAVTSAREAEAKSADGVIKAEQGIQKAAENTQRAREGEAKAEKALSDLLAKGPVDAQAVESARQSLEATDRGVTSATEQLADAEKNLAEIQQFEAVDAANELTAAHLQLSQTTLQLAQARLSASQAIPTLGNPFAQQAAQLQVRQATLAQSQARENLTKISQFGTQADNNAAAAQKSVRDASQRVTDSLDSQAAAQNKLAEAMAGDPQFNQKVADAKIAVRDAAIAVRDAESSETDAVRSLSDARRAQVDAHQGVVDAEDNVTKAKQRAQDATITLRDAQYGLDDAIQKALEGGADIGRLYDELAAKYPELIPILNGLKDLASSVLAVDRGLNSLAPFFAGQLGPNPPSPNQAIPGTSGIEAILGPALNPPGRAGGGDVSAGWYTVGEHGKELLHVGAGSGYVSPNRPAGDGGSAAVLDALAQMFAGGFDLHLPDGSTLGRVYLRGASQYRSAFAGRQ